MGQIFEMIIHHVFSDGWQPNGPIPQPIPLVSDGKNPPTFSADSPAPPIPCSPPYYAPAPGKLRESTSPVKLPIM